MIKTNDYAEYLRQKVKGGEKKRKGERTRDKLKIIAAELLKEKTFRDLKVTDICERAGIAPGTFYLYYNNKRELTLEVMTEFVEMFNAEVQSNESTDPFTAISVANYAFLKSVIANAGLMRCVLQVSDEEPEFALLQQRINDRWYTKVATAVSRRLHLENPSVAFFIVHALGSMMDQLVYRLVIQRDPYLIKVVEDLDLDDVGINDYLSVIWYRVLYGEDPPGLETRPARGFKDMKLGRKK